MTSQNRHAHYLQLSKFPSYRSGQYSGTHSFNFKVVCGLTHIKLWNWKNGCYEHITKGYKLIFYMKWKLIKQAFIWYKNMLCVKELTCCEVKNFGLVAFPYNSDILIVKIHYFFSCDIFDIIRISCPWWTKWCVEKVDRIKLWLFFTKHLKVWQQEMKRYWYLLLMKVLQKVCFLMGDLISGSILSRFSQWIK